MLEPRWFEMMPGTDGGQSQSNQEAINNTHDEGEVRQTSIKTVGSQNTVVTVMVRGIYFTN